MVIYLDQYRKAQTSVMAGMQRHGEEKLCVNGLSTLSMLATPDTRELNALSPQLPEDFSSVDVGALYNRVYALASQI